MIGILVSVRSRCAHGTSCMRAEQFAERKCCVSQWCLPRNLPTSVSLTSLMQPRRTAEPAASPMKEDLDRRRGRVRYPWRTTQRWVVYCNGSSALPAPERANTANRMRAIFRDARMPNSAHVVAEAPRGWRKSLFPSLPVSETDSCAAGLVLFTPPDLRAQQVVTGAVLMRARSSYSAGRRYFSANADVAYEFRPHDGSHDGPGCRRFRAARAAHSLGAVSRKAGPAKLCSHFADELRGHQRRRNAACTEGLLFGASSASTFIG